MDKILFQKLLKTANLKKKDLAGILKITTASLNNWGSSKEIPYWVESWLENYIQAKNYILAKEIFCSKKKQEI